MECKVIKLLFWVTCQNSASKWFFTSFNAVNSEWVLATSAVNAVYLELCWSFSFSIVYKSGVLCIIVLYFTETASLCASQFGLELTILLPLPPDCCNYRHVLPPLLHIVFFFKKKKGTTMKQLFLLLFKNILNLN